MGHGLYKVHYFLIGIGIVLLPILASFGMHSSTNNLLGGMGQDASFYPFFLGIVIWACQIIFFRIKVYVPADRSAFFLFMFIIAIFLSAMWNIDSISTYTFVGKSSWGRYATQSCAILLYVVGALYFYNFFKVFKGDRLSFFFHCIFISFLVTGLYSFFEITAMFSAYSRDVVGAIDFLLRGDEVFSFYGYRLRSLAFEASLFGTYMSVVFPILVYFSVKEKRSSIYTILLLYGIVMLIMTLSRNAYFICLVECVFLFAMYRKEVRDYYWKQILFILVGVIILFFCVVTLFDDFMFAFDIGDVLSSLFKEDAGSRDTSNLTRLGSMVGALNIFMDHPFFGIGWGLGSYHLNDFYPSWAWLSWEVSVGFINAPIIFGTYPRVLAELGLFGFVGWVGCWFSVLYGLWRKSIGTESHREWRILFISLVGVLLSGFNMDIFHFWMYWLLLGFFWAGKESMRQS